MDRPPGPPSRLPAATVVRCPRCSRSSFTAGWRPPRSTGPIASVALDDRRVLGPGTTPAGLRRALVGRRFTAARRRGKLLLLDTGSDDGRRPVARGALRHDRGPPGGRPGRPSTGSATRPATTQRSGCACGSASPTGASSPSTTPGGSAGSPSTPTRTLLGPDAADGHRWPGCATALASPAPGGGPPLKARLLDQSRLAGVGNLLADEILWRAVAVPAAPPRRRSRRPSCGGSTATSGPPSRSWRQRGGSHTGDLIDERRPGGRCPRDGAELVSATSAGRTTWWCPAHQR